MTTSVLQKSSWIIGIVLIAVLLVFYILQVIQATEASFFISNYEKQIIDFTQENKILESDFSQLDSLANLEAILSSLSYEKVEKIHYLRVPGVQVAAK